MKTFKLYQVALVLFVMLSSDLLYAQVPIHAIPKYYNINSLHQHLNEDNIYFVDTSLKKYCGTWHCNHDDTSWTFAIKKTVLDTSPFMKRKWKFELLQCLLTKEIAGNKTASSTIEFSSKSERTVSSQIISATIRDDGLNAYGSKEVEYEIMYRGDKLLLRKLNIVKEGIAYRIPMSYPKEIEFTRVR